jgi:DNA-binding NarL/FixJ family response regulator
MNANVELSPVTGTKRIFILDDHPLTRHGITHLLESDPALKVCGEAETAPQALAAMAGMLPDLVLADITLPSKSGLEFIKDMKALYPDVPVLVLSMHDENIYAERALRAGARGYIMKTEGEQHLLEAVHQVLDGRIYVSNELSQSLLNRAVGKPPPQNEDSFGELTDREFEVFQLIGQGLSTGEISGRLHISAKTVETHRIHLKKKLNLNNSVELTCQAVKWAASNQLV